MLQRIPIAPAQVKGGNTSENLLNKIHFMEQKKSLKNIYNNTMNSIQT